MTSVIDIFLLGLLVVVAIAMLRVGSLLATVMLSGIYSLITAALFTVLDAVDVAFTEAAVGAGIATVLFLATMAVTGKWEKPTAGRHLGPLAVVVATGAALLWGTLDMPHFGDPGSPAHSRVTDAYITESMDKTTVPNMVTAVLASYRGYDTMGEVVVIFTAVVGVLLLIGRIRRRADEPAVENGKPGNGKPGNEKPGNEKKDSGV